MENKTDLRALAVLSAAYALAMFNRTSFSEVAAQLDVAAIHAQALAAVGSAFFWAYLLCQIPAGLMVDALGPRKVAAWGCLAMAGGSALFALPQLGVAGMAAGRALCAAGCVSVFLALLGYCSDSFAGRSSSALGQAMVVGNLGGAVSGAPLAAALVAVDWRMAWMALAAGSAALAWAAWAAIPKPSASGPSDASVPALRRIVPELGRALSHVDVYLAAGALAGMAGAFHAFAGFGAHLLAERAGLSPMAGGCLVTSAVAGFAAGAAYWGSVGDDPARRRKAAARAPLGACLIWGLLCFATPDGALPLALAVFAAGALSSCFALAYPMLGELTAGKAQGSIKAAANCGIALGAAAAQLAQGALPARWAAAPCFALAMFGAACFAAMAWRLRPRGATIDAPAAPESAAAELA